MSLRDLFSTQLLIASLNFPKRNVSVSYIVLFVNILEREKSSDKILKMARKSSERFAEKLRKNGFSPLPKGSRLREFQEAFGRQKAIVAQTLFDFLEKEPYIIDREAILGIYLSHKNLECNRGAGNHIGRAVRYLGIDPRTKDIPLGIALKYAFDLNHIPLIGKATKQSQIRGLYFNDETRLVRGLKEDYKLQSPLRVRSVNHAQ